MLEAVNHGPRFTISLKRSTQNLSAIHKPPADYPIFGSEADMCTALANVRRPKADIQSSPRHFADRCRPADNCWLGLNDNMRTERYQRPQTAFKPGRWPIKASIKADDTLGAENVPRYVHCGNKFALH
jgi:hypothetical protein